MTTIVFRRFQYHLALLLGTATIVGCAGGANTIKFPDVFRVEAPAPAPQRTPEPAKYPVRATAATPAVSPATAPNPASNNPIASNGTFNWKNDRLNEFADLFDKGCKDPAEYSAIKGRFRSAASSPTGLANQLVWPQRTVFHVMGTDIATIELYYPNACQRATRMNQCRPGATLTAEQACDCAAGYPGQVDTGTGTGEVIVSANRAIGVSACKIASDRAQGDKRLRYLAQQGRAEMYKTGNTYDGYQILKRTIAAGYRRAEVDLARAHMRDVEFAGVSPDYLKDALTHLAAARAAGIKETDIVLQSIKEVARVKKWNVDFYKTWTAITTP